MPAALESSLSPFCIERRMIGARFAASWGGLRRHFNSLYVDLSRALFTVQVILDKLTPGPRTEEPAPGDISTFTVDPQLNEFASAAVEALNDASVAATRGADACRGELLVAAVKTGQQPNLIGEQLDETTVQELLGVIWEAGAFVADLVEVLGLSHEKTAAGLWRVRNPPGITHMGVPVGLAFDSFLRESWSRRVHGIWPLLERAEQDLLPKVRRQLQMATLNVQSDTAQAGLASESAKDTEVDPLSSLSDAEMAVIQILAATEHPLKSDQIEAALQRLPPSLNRSKKWVDSVIRKLIGLGFLERPGRIGVTVSPSLASRLR